MSDLEGQETTAFELSAREAVYGAIRGRRDVRRFRPGRIPDDVLARILSAGGSAPSVGFSQPWNFILLRDLERRKKLHRHVEEERRLDAERFIGAKREQYKSFKLEGILESDLNLCVTCDRERFGPTILGRNTLRDADVYSAVAAVQNIWIAARCEGVGVGWVSLLRNDFLRDLLALPEHVLPVAYLCIGFPRTFRKRPMLETQQWLPRLPLQELVFQDSWEKSISDELATEIEGLA